MRRYGMWLVLTALLTVGAWGVAGADGCFVPRHRTGARPQDISEPNQKALIVFQDGVEDLIVQARYQGGDEDFAWVVPTPARPQVGKCSNKLFHELSRFTAPPMPTAPSRSESNAGGARDGVTVYERKQVGVYDVTVLGATGAGGLLHWLNSHGYAVSSRLKGLLDGYIRRGWTFTAMRIDLRKAGGGNPEKVRRLLASGELQSLRLTFPASQPIYPLKISSANRGSTEVLLYLMTPGEPDTLGFQQQYSRRLDAGVCNLLTERLPEIHRGLVLTKLVRVMRSEDMVDDLVFRLGRKQHPMR